MTQQVLLSWSGGKDSALALQQLQQDPATQVVGLITTFVERYDRVQIHGVRRLMVLAQAESMGLPLHAVWVPPGAGNPIYEHAVRTALVQERRNGVEAVAFGDLLLPDIRAYRERLVAPTGLEPLFPLWGQPTNALAHRVINSGLRATLTCVDPSRVPPAFLGRSYDTALIRELPHGVDPCGENGEFHTFVHGGPPFRYPLETMLGVHREWQGHVYADLLPVAKRRPA